MKRAILAPAVLPAAPLDELKEWLAITTTRDDLSLTALLRTSLEACEGFTRAMPLESLCEEILPATRGWHRLTTQPVQSITQLEAVTNDGTRSPLDPGDYLFDMAVDGSARVNLLQSVDEPRMAVRFTAGMAPDWDSLPDGLRHGVIRLAAHHYRERNEGSAARNPPSAVAALWQPWRRMTLT